MTAVQDALSPQKAGPLKGGETAFIFSLVSFLAEINWAVYLGKATAFTLKSEELTTGSVWSLQIKASFSIPACSKETWGEKKTTKQVYWKLIHDFSNILFPLSWSFIFFLEKRLPYMLWADLQQRKSGYWSLSAYLLTCQGLIFLPPWEMIRTGKRDCRFFFWHLTYNQCWRHVLCTRILGFPWQEIF